MKKFTKLLALVLALTLSISLLAGCSRNSDTSSSAQEPSAPAAPASGQLSAVHQAVKDAYGENYIPSMPLDDIMLRKIKRVTDTLNRQGLRVVAVATKYLPAREGDYQRPQSADSDAQRASKGEESPGGRAVSC